MTVSRPRVVVEPIEPRILLSADITPAMGQGIAEGLDRLGDWADQIQAIGDFADDLPLIGDSIGDLFDLGETLRQEILQAIQDSLPTALSDPDATAADVVAAINAALPGDPVSDVDPLGTDEVRFNITRSIDRMLVVPLDFGEAAQDLGLDVDADLDLRATLDVDFDFGFLLDPELSPEEAFFIDFADDGGFRVSLELQGFVDGGATTPTLDIPIDLGFVDAAIEGGTISLVAALDLQIPDGGDGLVSLDELLSGGLSPDAISVAPTTSFSASLPITLDFDSGDPGSFAVSLADGVTLQIGGLSAANLFDLPAFDLSVDTPDALGFDVDDFSNLSAREVFSSIVGLANQLQTLTRALDVVGGVPFVDDALSSVIDFTAMIQELLEPLFDAGLTGISDLVTDFVGNADFDIAINGGTAVTVSVASIVDGYASVDDLIGAVNTALASTPVAGLPGVSFLGEVLEAVAERGQLQLRATSTEVVDFALSNVSDVARAALGLETEMITSALLNFATMQDLQALLNDGGLLGTAIDAVYDALANTIRFDLDMSGAISGQVGLDLFESVDLGLATLELVGGGLIEATGEASFNLGVGLDLSDVSATTLLADLNGGGGVGVSAAGSADLLVSLKDGTTFDVDLFGATTLQDVIDAIASASGGNVSASIDSGQGLVLVDATTGTGTFQVSLAAGSSAAIDLGFGLLAGDVANLGSIIGGSILDRLFIDAGSSLAASVTISTPDPLNLYASLGFVTVGAMAELTQDLVIESSLSLVDPDMNGRITLDELVSRDPMGVDEFDFAAAPVPTIAITSGELTLDLKLEEDASFGLDVTGAQVVVDFSSVGDGTIVPQYSFSGAGLEDLLEGLGNLGIGDLLRLAVQIGTNLAEDFGVLNAELPIVGASLGDLVDFFNDGVADVAGEFSNLRELFLTNGGATGGFEALMGIAPGLPAGDLSGLIALDKIDLGALGIDENLLTNLFMALEQLGNSILGLSTNFNLLTDSTPGRLLASFGAVDDLVSQLRSITEANVDAAGITGAEKVAFLAAQAQVVGNVAAMRQNIPSGDTILRILFDAVGFELPVPDDASFVSTLRGFLAEADSALDDLRDEITGFQADLPDDVPASVTSAFGTTVSAIDAALTALAETDEFLLNLETAIEESISVNPVDLLRALDAGRELASQAASAKDAIQGAIDDIEAIEVGDRSAELQTLLGSLIAQIGDPGDMVESLFETLTARAASLTSAILSEFGGKLLRFDFNGDTLMLNFEYDLDFIDAAGLPDGFELDFSLFDGGSAVPINIQGELAAKTIQFGGGLSLGFGVDLIDDMGEFQTEFFLQAGSGIEFNALLELEGEVGVTIFSINAASLGDVGAGDPATLRIGNAALDADAPAVFSLSIADTGAADGRALLDDLDVTLTLDAGFEVILPVYVLNNPVMWDADDDAMTADVPLEIVLDGGLTSLSDFDVDLQLEPRMADAILGSLTELSLTTILEAIDLFLVLLEDGLGSDFISSLPIVGNTADDFSSTIGSLRDDFYLPFKADLESFVAGLSDKGEGAIEAAVDGLLADAISAAGLGGILTATSDLRPGDPMAVNSLVSPDTEFVIDLALNIDEMMEFDFDLGLGGLDFQFLDMEGSVEVALQLALGLGIGVGRTGIFFEFEDDVDPAAGDISGNLTIGLSDDAKVVIDLFLLTLEATPAVDAGLGLEGVQFDAGIDVEVFEGRATFADFGALTFAPTLTADLDIDLFLDTGLTVSGFIPDGALPSIQAYLNIDWAFSTDPGADVAPTVEILELSLDLGQFFDLVLGDLIDALNDFTAPLRPIFAILDTEIPVISDLAKLLGQDPITFADAVSLLGSGFESVQTFITIFETIDAVLDLIGDVADGNRIVFGDLDLTGVGGGLDLRDVGAGSTISGLSAADLAGQISSAAGDIASQIGAAGGTEAVNRMTTTAQAGFDTSSGLGLTLPIFDDPTQIFGLLLGKRVDLVAWDIPRLAAEFGFSWRFGPIIPPVPLFATIAGSFEIFADFFIGFDTRGLETGNFFDGFFFNDMDVLGGTNDIPELGMIARFSATAELSIVVASAGVTGGIEAGIFANWNDPDGDGKVYADELAANFNRGLDCIFDLEGALTAFLEAFVKIGFDTPFGFVTLFSETFELARVTLVDFSITCPPLPPPIPASNMVDAGNPNDVYLNIGDRAEYRQPGATDIAEEVFIIAEREFEGGEIRGLEDINGNDAFELEEILAANDFDGNGMVDSDTIGFFGFGQFVYYTDVTKIIGDAGVEDDEITVDPSVMVAVSIAGGAGNDVIRGGSGQNTLWGDNRDGTGDGADVLLGGAANDVIHGGGGDDEIVGFLGDDELHGDGGDDRIFGNEGNNAVLASGSDDDRIWGGAGIDDIKADDGADVVYGGSGADSIAGGWGDDELHGGSESDLIQGGEGSDTIFGDGGNDILFGESNKAAVGTGGNDTIHGGDGNDTIRDAFVSDQGEGIEQGDDVFYGDAGDDLLVTASGADRAFGGAGNDTIDTGDGHDYIEGGGGDDTIHAGLGNDRVIGGSATAVGGTGIDGPGAGSFDTDGRDTISGGSGNDVIIGDNGGFFLGAALVQQAEGVSDFSLVTTFSAGGAGADVITGGEGADRIFGGGGDDTLLADDFGGVSADIAVGDQGYMTAAMLVAASSLAAGSGGDDDLVGFGGNDILIGGDGEDDITGSQGADILVGDNAELTLAGTGGDPVPVTPVVWKVVSRDTDRGGDDRLLGGTGSDIAVGGFADDYISGGGSSDAPSPGDTNGDILLGDHGTVVLIDPVLGDHDVFSIDDTPAHNGRDRIVGSSRDDIVIGGGDVDSIEGLSGADILLGDHGIVERDAGYVLERVASLFEGSGAGDIIIGGQGGDIALGEAGDDLIEGGVGADILLGDNGEVLLAAGLVTTIRTTDTASATGGVDTILGEADADIVLGGVQGDVLSGGDAADILLGDNGQVTVRDVDADPGTRDLAPTRIATTQPGLGGVDNVTGDAGDDIVMGGAEGDFLYGDGVAELASDGDDTVLGDNGLLDWLDASLDAGLDPSTLDLITSTDPTFGGDDEIYGGGADDFLLGGTDSDVVRGGSGEDLIFGDHARRHVQAPSNSNFFAIDTQLADAGDDDQLYGEAGDDILLGQQGDDEIFGGAGDDDLIGGHNVMGGIDEIDPGANLANDHMDGGSGFDVLAGDNATIVRQLGTSINARFRVLAGQLMYAADGSADVTAAFQEDPDAPQPIGRDVVLLDHDADLATQVGVREFGADRMVGGADNDVLFGGLDGDQIHGDGSIDELSLDFDIDERASDGDDYIEGNGGVDTLFGGLGQDDLIGGSSDLFGLVSPEQRPDDGDLIFGGAAIRVGRNEFVADGDALIAAGDRHARDADVILGDNGRILRLVGVDGGPAGDALSFGYDTSDAARTSFIVPRAVDLLDYVPEDEAASIGGADRVRGESGDDFIHGQAGNDVLFGDSENDNIHGESGTDWISGGTGEDAVLGDTGKIMNSRGGVAEPLYGIEATTEDSFSTPGKMIEVALDREGVLKHSVDLEPFDVGQDDVIYGGLGDDALHGGAGNDAISGAEALPDLFLNPQAQSEVEIGADGRIVARSGGVVVEGFYDTTNALARLEGHVLNFDASEGEAEKGDGEDMIFGDVGDDWLVGGSGRDRVYGGFGGDLLNLDDDLGTNGGANDVPDTGVFPISENADIAYGGGGRDTLIGNTGADRLIDWTGEFNNFVLPFAPFGNATVERQLQPYLPELLYLISASDGADQTRSGAGLGEADRNGEPYGELGLVRPQDPEWQDQHGAPDGQQAGNTPGGSKDTKGPSWGGGNGETFGEGGGGGGSGSGAFTPAAPIVSPGDSPSDGVGAPATTSAAVLWALDQGAFEVPSADRMTDAAAAPDFGSFVSSFDPAVLGATDGFDAGLEMLGAAFGNDSGAPSTVVVGAHPGALPDSSETAYEVVTFDPAAADLGDLGGSGTPGRAAIVSVFDGWEAWFDQGRAPASHEVVQDRPATPSLEGMSANPAGSMDSALSGMAMLVALGDTLRRRTPGRPSWAVAVAPED